MSLPTKAQYVVAGAGIHGMSTAWRLAEKLTANGESVDGRIVIIDKADRILLGQQVLPVVWFVIIIFNLLCAS